MQNSLRLHRFMLDWRRVPRFATPLARRCVRIALVALLPTWLFVSPACTSTLAGRYVFWNFPTVADHTRFPVRRIAPAARPERIAVRLQPMQSLIAADAVLWSPPPSESGQAASLVAANFESFAAKHETRSLLIARDNTLVYEEYFNGAARESLMAGFSVSKSVVSMLVQLALARGEVEDLDQPLADYIPQFRGDPKGAIPLRDLLNMTSGIRFQRASWPWSDSVRSYHSTDLRAALIRAEIEAPPGQRWLYSEYNPPLLAWALERRSGRSLAETLETQVWARFMEGEAQWLMDDAERQVELAHAGFYARARDYLRLGLIYQNDGVLGSRRVLPSGLARASTTLNADDPKLIRAVAARFAPGRYAYKNAWWLPLDEEGAPIGDCIAAGLYGQFIYVSPARRIVIVRTGSGPGEPDIGGWFEILGRLAAELDRARIARGNTKSF